MREPMEMEKRIQLVGTGGLREIRKTGGTYKVEDKDTNTKSRYSELPVVRKGSHVDLDPYFCFSCTFLLWVHLHFFCPELSCCFRYYVLEEQNLGSLSGYSIPTDQCIRCGALDPRQVRFEIHYSSQRNAQAKEFSYKVLSIHDWTLEARCRKLKLAVCVKFYGMCNLWFRFLEQLHQHVHKIPSILHLKPTFSILHHHFYKTLTSVYLFYKIFQ